MRFHQLKLGTRFRYRGLLLYKVSPLMAATEMGEAQTLIPRSAEITPVDDRGRQLANTVPETLRGHRLETELDRLAKALAQAAARTDPPLTDAQHNHLMTAIHTASQDLIARIAADD